MRKPPKTAAEKVAELLALYRRGDDECWAWKGMKSSPLSDSREYITVRADSRPQLIHRLAYSVLVGPIPDGLEIDHLCRNTYCMNPQHLEPVTHRVNMLRGRTAAAANARRTHCVRGHPFEGDNLRITPIGKRRCHSCDLERQRVKGGWLGNLHGRDRTHCIRGHELSGDNLVIKRWRKYVKRNCRICIRAAEQRRQREKRKAA